MHEGAVHKAHERSPWWPPSDVTFPADRIVTSLGPLDVAVQLRQDGRCLARLAGDYPELARLGGAIGDTEDEAVGGWPRWSSERRRGLVTCGQSV